MIGDDHGREVEIFLVRRARRPAARRSATRSSLPGTTTTGAAWSSCATSATRCSPGTTCVSAGAGPVPAQRLADLHATYRGRAEVAPTTLDAVVGIFEPDRIRPFAGDGLVDAALRGWEYFAEVAPDEVGQRVLALAQDGAPLVRALEARPPTLLHGDVSTVNIALEPDARDPLRLGRRHGRAGRDATSPGCSSAARTSSTCRSTSSSTLQREVAGADHDEASLLGWRCSAASPGWAGTRRSTSSSTRTKPSARGSGKDSTGGWDRPGWPSRREKSDGRRRAVPPYGPGLERPGGRGACRRVVGPDAVRGLVGARAGEPRDLREQVGDAVVRRLDRSRTSATSSRATCSATTRRQPRSRRRRTPWPRPRRGSRRAERSPCRSETPRSTSTSPRSPPITWSTGGTSPPRPAATRGSTRSVVAAIAAWFADRGGALPRGRRDRPGRRQDR